MRNMGKTSLFPNNSDPDDHIPEMLAEFLLESGFATDVHPTHKALTVKGIKSCIVIPLKTEVGIISWDTGVAGGVRTKKFDLHDPKSLQNILTYLREFQND
jgi:hypothetical protein